MMLTTLEIKEKQTNDPQLEKVLLQKASRVFLRMDSQGLSKRKPSLPCLLWLRWVLCVGNNPKCSSVGDGMGPNGGGEVISSTLGD